MHSDIFMFNMTGNFHQMFMEPHNFSRFEFSQDAGNI
jgi:hypothetical protein